MSKGVDTELPCEAPAREARTRGAPPRGAPPRGAFESRQPTVYQIRIKGHLGSEWTDWFGGLTVTPEDGGDTLLTGSVVDQAELYGLLRKVRDLGMPLVSVISIEPCNQPVEFLKPPPSGGCLKFQLEENDI